MSAFPAGCPILTVADVVYAQLFGPWLGVPGRWWSVAQQFVTEDALSSMSLPTRIVITRHMTAFQGYQAHRRHYHAQAKAVTAGI